LATFSSKIYALGARPAHTVKNTKLDLAADFKFKVMMISENALALNQIQPDKCCVTHICHDSRIALHTYQNVYRDVKRKFFYTPIPSIYKVSLN
jgi:hypothetical protein